MGSVEYCARSVVCGVAKKLTVEDLHNVLKEADEQNSDNQHFAVDICLPSRYRSVVTNPNPKQGERRCI